MMQGTIEVQYRSHLQEYKIYTIRSAYQIVFKATVKSAG